MENSTTGNEIWFYELNGERKGGISETDLITLIRNGTLRHGSSVWKKGFADWTSIEETQLHSSEYRAEQAVASGHFIYITLILNIALSFLDEKRLKQAGTDTSTFGGWVWLVPVYLYQRSQALKQNLAYFIVWIVCFLLIVVGA